MIRLRICPTEVGTKPKKKVNPFALAVIPVFFIAACKCFIAIS